LNWYKEPLFTDRSKDWYIAELRAAYNRDLEVTNDEIIREFINGVFKAWTEDKITA
jgi:hypothetical protein